MNKKEGKDRVLLMWLSVLLNVGLLLYFKYANFFIENLQELLGIIGLQGFHWTQIALPIGISFFTFQSLSYTLDIYRREEQPLEKVTDYMLYILSFPQMIAGPIVRFSTVAEDIRNRTELIDDKLQGLFRFFIGLGKKVLIANTMGAQADLILNGNLSDLSTSSAWVGVLAYTFQIYFDFSGYSDMAIGLGRIMGFRFPENFNSPYISKSITEFWRRWHITLGSWMRDYLYIPLGGSKGVSISRLYFNLWFVFLISGFWHGASWNFLIWGAFHGLFLVLERAGLKKFYQKIGGFSIPIIFLITVVGWVIFRVETVAGIKEVLSAMFSTHFTEVEYIPGFIPKLWIAIGFSFCCALPFFSKVENAVFYPKSFSLARQLLYTSVSLMLLILTVASITTSSFNPFIYFRF